MECGNCQELEPQKLWGWSDSRLDALVFAGAFLFFCGWLAALGPGLDGDALPYLSWGREFVSGAKLCALNPNYTVPKWMPILTTALCHVLPGWVPVAHWYVLFTALAGAGIVMLAGRLARRLGGRACGLIAVALALTQVEILRYVLNGQSTVYTTVFSLGALVVLLRDEFSPASCVGAGLLVFLAGMARQEAAAFSVVVGFCGVLRLGWRRPGWPLLATAIGVASFPVGMLLDKVAFGSFGYSQEIVRLYTKSVAATVPTTTVGFLVKAAKVIAFYRDYAWVQFLMACIGLGLLLNRRRLWQAAPLVLCPAAIVGATWLMIQRGILFNERCYFVTTYPILVLASLGIAHLSLGREASSDFLGSLPLRLRRAALVTLLLAFSIAPSLTRPIPRDDSDTYRGVEQASDFLRGQLRGQGRDLFLSTEDSNHVLYRLRLPTEHYVLRGGFSRVGKGVRVWLVTSTWQLKVWAVDPTVKWGMVPRWHDPTGRVLVFCSEDGRP